MKKVILIITIIFNIFLFIFQGCDSKTDALDYYEMGKNLYSSQNPDEALPFFEKAVSDDPELKQAYVMAAKCYFYLNREKSAIDILEEVLRMKPDYTDANFWAGKVFYFISYP